MARVDANINKETLGFICSQIGVTVPFLSQKTGIAEEKLSTWFDTSNADYPTLIQAKALAKTLKVPFAGLYMDKANLPIKQLPSLRNLRTLPFSYTQDDSSLNLAVVELIRYHDFLTSSESDMDIDVPQLSLPIIADTANAADYANTIRAFFEIELETQFKLQSSRQFYLYVRQQIENKGVFVHCFTGVDVEIVRGISIYNDTAPIIGINDNDRYPAKIFSIIHELVHIIKQQSTLCNEMYSSFSAKNEEVFCNAIAGEVLVPSTSLNAYLMAKNITKISLDIIETMSKRFNVSREVVARRLFDTNKFSKDEYDTFANEIHQEFVQKREAEKFARQEGRGSQIPKK